MRRLPAVVALLFTLAVAGCGSTQPRQAEQVLSRPNVVFILVDDLEAELLQFMPNVQRMMAEGTTFENFVVADSRCCPSRASMLTGLLPHNSGVWTNSPPYGGHRIFERNGMPDRTFAVTMRDRGYRTALFGKYMNGYATFNGGVPPGWTDWAATARAYQGFDYTLNVDGKARRYGESEEDYITDVIARMGVNLVNESLTDRRPFFMQLSTFTPHLPAVPAPRHIGLFPNLRAPRTPAFNRRVQGAPRWLAVRKRLKRATVHRIDALHRKRARSMVSVDEMIGAVRDRVRALGLTNRTYFVFGSDNGYHMGERRLEPGKMTAFDEDVRIPLIVTGPGVPAGATVEALVQNTDLAPTFEELAGAPPRPDVDGGSLVGMMHGEPPPTDWRPAALIEHRQEYRSKFSRRDPDAQPPASGNPPGYVALRIPNGTYVEYRTGEREFYDHISDPHELFNAYQFLTGRERRTLSDALAYLLTCDGMTQCSTATPPVRRAARVAVSGQPARRR